MADTFNHRVQKLSPEGLPCLEIADAGGWGPLREPVAVALDAAECLFVADREANRVLKFSAEGVPLRCWPAPGERSDLFDRPRDVRVGRDGSVYVGDRDNLRLHHFAASGARLGSIALDTDPACEAGCFILVDEYAVIPDRMNDRLLCVAFA
ncbi:MAG TPA: NHL repeat-containing protein [Gemmataceae bacterium]|nr:NHL repeat-containing protein [Gemmataceae bacterium]